MNKLFVYLMIILLTLFLRDLPYFNVYVIRQLWLVYFLLFLTAIFSNLKISSNAVLSLSLLFLLAMLVLSLLKFTFFAEAMGIFLYFLFWILIIFAVRDSHRQI